MEDKNCINAGRPVYFSYARNSQKKPEWEHISDCMDKLLEAFHEKNIEYRLDKRDIGTGDKISKFEEEIGWKSEVVVIVFSDKYFRSMHCMYEFVQIKRALEQYPEKRLMCIKSGDFNLSDVNYIMELERYWGNEEQDYKDIEYHRLREHSETERAALQNGFYMEDIRKLYSFFSSINYSNAQSIDYDNFTNDIIRYYKNTPEPPKLIPKPKVTPQPMQRVTSEPAQKTKNNPLPRNDKNVEPKIKVKVEPQFVVRSAQQSPVYVKYQRPKKRRFLRFILIVLLCFGFVYYGKEVKGYENISDFVAYLITELFEKFK
ncbi:MAG: toll/interleukin-1 receptor domain-containing protein [Bacteroidales bacterium]|nr:toll/interleukin-1 receptor domain-containing protein [Bacteroidales bacterium]